MKKLYLIPGIIILCLICFFAGRLTTKPVVEKQVVDRVVEVEKVVSTTKTTKTVTKPDGTIETVVVESKKESSKKADKEKKSEVKKTKPDSPYRPNYAVYAAAESSLDLRPSYRVGLSRRIVGNLWLDGGYSPSSGTVSIGLRIEF